MTTTKHKRSRHSTGGANRTSGPAQYDFVLLAIVTALVGLGLVMVFSASYVQASAAFGQASYYFLRQLRWLALGTIVLLLAASINYRYWQQLSLPLMAGTVVLLLAVLLFGTEHFGARRHLFGPSVQPAEIGKLTITIYIAYWLTSKGERLRDISYGLVPFAVLLGLVAGLLLLQPDFGTTVLVVATALVMFFVAGADPRQLLLGLVTSGGTLYLAIKNVDYARQRIDNYLAALKDLRAADYQTQTGVKAIVKGGLLGTGIGQGSSKGLGGVPFPWTDSIFAVIGEELGLVGALVVIGLFLALAWRGLRIALQANDQFGMVLGCGLTASIVLQAFVNMAVNTVVLPYSGLTLPFISYGGSSLLASMAGIGVLLSISRYGQAEPAIAKPAANPGRGQPALAAVRRRNWWARLSDFGGAGSPKRGRNRGRGRASRVPSGYSVKASTAERVAFRLTRTRRALGRRLQGRSARSTTGKRRIPRRGRRR